MKYLSLTCLLSLLAFSLSAQDGWNWPEDPQDSAQMVEKHTMYTDNLRLGVYDKAISPLNYILENQPDLNSSIYVHGAKIFEEVSQSVDDATRKNNLQDSSLLMYEMRLEYFPEDSTTVYDRYPYAAYRFNYKDINRYPELYSLFQTAYDMLGNDISTYNLLAYMNLVATFHRYKPEDISDEEVLDVYDRISELISYKIEHGGREEKLEELQERIDGILVNNSGVTLTCDQIEDRYVARFREDKSNIDLAKKVLAYSLQFKCTDQEFFIEAAEAILAEEENPSLAKTIADRYNANDQRDKALEFYNKALDLEEDNLKRADILYKMAQIYSIMGQKPTSRTYARRALNEDPSKKEAYSLIGNLYFNSASDCKKGESIVEDRSIYIAAYEMYQKAGDAEKMEQAKQQFPSQEELFTEDLYVGDSYKVECWINEEVTLRKRN